MPAPSPVTFEHFMQRALHHPQRGYYSRHIAGVGGRRGDFTTAPMLSDDLAAAIARWAAAALRETGCRDLIEIGPGEGSLAAAVWRALPRLTRWKCRLHLVETSEPLAKLQQQRLGRKATWHRTPHEALAACHGRAILFSNELVDAFPVRRFRKSSLGWQEIAVSFDPSGLPSEILLPPGPLPESTAFQITHPDGQCVEVHESYRRWLESWLPDWRHGRMLTIDYGATADRLYHRRPHGTIRGYLLNQRIEGPAIYQNEGRQDLTADVNFSDLADWSAPWMHRQQLVPLADFLGPIHPGSPLNDPAGAGTAFLVLDQWRDSALRPGGVSGTSPTGRSRR